MKVSVLQENISWALSVVSRAVSPRSTSPVLANVLMATDEGRLRLSATNLELGITCWIGAKIEEDGSTTIPARIFSDLVNTLPDGQVDMNLTEETQTLNVISGASNTDIKCIDSQEFPPMPVLDLNEGVQINMSDLKEIIRQVVFASYAGDARPVLTGVLVTLEGNTLTMVAADGFRLSVRTAELPQAVEQSVKAIIPARALSELARIAGDDEDTITMALPPGRGQVIFRLKDIELVSQLIEGEFPEYQQIIPTSHNTRTIISTEAFLGACKRAEIFAREGSYIVKLNIEPGNGDKPGSIEISAQSEETGSNETTVDATVEGPSIVIGFNVRFLREVLDVVNTPNVALETTAPAAQGVVRPLGEEDFLHVIMPINL